MEMVVDGVCAPIDSLLGVEHPFRFAASAASGEDEAREGGVPSCQGLCFFSKVRWGKEAEHGKVVGLLEEGCEGGGWWGVVLGEATAEGSEDYGFTGRGGGYLWPCLLVKVALTR